jgi:transglutaminase-like putative cysteine protease
MGSRVAAETFPPIMEKGIAGMLIRFGYDIVISCVQDTPLICLLSVRPDRLPDVTEPEVMTVTPAVPSTLYFDLFGNTCRRIMAPAGRLHLQSTGVISDSGVADAVDVTAMELPVQNLPDESLLYLQGSRYCETDRMSQQAWDLFGKLPPGWSRVQAICDFVHNLIAFDYLEARSTRTAMEAWREGKGVCRDYAHLAITLCRCLNIPARYVTGYLPDIGVPVTGPMDYAAWMEVNLGGRWWTFDPRNNMARIGRIKVAQGRDAADVPLIQSFGPHVMTHFEVICDEVRPAKLAGG